MSEKGLQMNSSLGDAFQISLGAGAEQKIAAEQSIQSAMIWTSGTDVYVNFYTDATAEKFKLPADVLFPVPVENLKHVSIFNDDASAAIVYVIWRGR